MTRWFAGGGGAAPPPIVRSARITSGDLNPLPNTSGGWQVLTQQSAGNPAFELSVPAVSGEWVEISTAFMRYTSLTAFFDVGVQVGASVVRYLGSGSSSPAIEGEPAYYPPAAGQFLGAAATKGLSVASGDLDGDSVRFVLVCKANATGRLYAGTNYPFYWRAANWRTVD